jgi:hypothetical protein
MERIKMVLREGPIRRRLREWREKKPRPELSHQEFPFVEKGSRLCGSDLERWLMDRGLSLFDTYDIVIGISDFKCTTLAFDEKGRIVDYDQYYADPEYVKVNWGRAIWQRLQHEAHEGKIKWVDRLLIFNNASPNCLEYYGLVYP